MLESPLQIDSAHNGGIAQLVEHSLDVRRVRGSSPFASTIKKALSKDKVFFMQAFSSEPKSVNEILYGDKGVKRALYH